MIIYKHGNLLDDDADALVNPVNCVGVMGKGLALQFSQRFPRYFEAYVESCAEGRTVPGEIWAYPSVHPDPVLITFPTKNHWRDPSRIQWIQDGLVNLRMRLTSGGPWSVDEIRHIAVPKLGCGLGGLDWERHVKPLVVAAFEDLEVEARVYE